jgi:hypothetical protein
MQRKAVEEAEQTEEAIMLAPSDKNDDDYDYDDPVFELSDEFQLASMTHDTTTTIKAHVDAIISELAPIVDLCKDGNDYDERSEAIRVAAKDLQIDWVRATWDRLAIIADDPEFTAWLQSERERERNSNA